MHLPDRRRGASWRGVLAAVCVAVVLAGAGCSSSNDRPGGITDAGAEGSGQSLPAWFPKQFPPPRDGVIVEVLDDPQTDNDAIELGRSVTWRVDRPYHEVLADVDAVLASIGWQPTDRLATGDEEDSQRTSIYIENGTVEVIRVYTDSNLKGVRVTVELPA